MTADNICMNQSRFTIIINAPCVPSKTFYRPLVQCDMACLSECLHKRVVRISPVFPQERHGFEVRSTISIDHLWHPTHNHGGNGNPGKKGNKTRKRGEGTPRRNVLSQRVYQNKAQIRL